MKGTFRLGMLTALCWGLQVPAHALQAMDDVQLADTTGQSLLNLAYTAPAGAGTGASHLDYGYYKMGLEGKLELNANIRNLQLGCGGVNGPGACDIDIQNVALSGLPTSYAADGTPQWANGRASSSAELTNPFIEFAFTNPNSPTGRQLAGVRLSAESITGLLTAGVENVANPTDGIKTFSGYLQVAPTPVTSKTQTGARFGMTTDQMIFSRVETDLGTRHVFTNVNAMNPSSSNYQAPPSGTQWGVAVAQQVVNFTFPQTTITGNRMSQLNLTVNDVPIPTIKIGATDGALRLRMDEGLLWVNNSTFFMGANGVNCQTAAYDPSQCTYIINLKANVEVKENFNLVHNLPLSGTGVYLSLQNQAMRWPGSNTDDVAQPGWWMSFAQPLNFGALNPTQEIALDDVLPQIAKFINTFLSTNPVILNFNEALGAAFGLPLYKAIGEINVAGTPAVMKLENLPLDNNQAVVPNCWGTLKFC